MRVPTPLLQIVPQAMVILHEEYDEGRVSRLAARLAVDGVLKDPPIAGRLPGMEQLIELDGTNRLMALRHLGLEHTLVQVVDYLDPAMRLSAWYHVVHQLALGDLLARCRPLGLRVEQVSVAEADRLLAARAVAAYLRGSDEGGVAHVLYASSDLGEQAQVLNELVHAYKFAGGPPVHRISSDEVDSWPGAEDAAILAHVSGRRSQNEGGTLVAFPIYTPQEVAQMALAATLLPSGVTRYLLPVRALDVHLPLSLLSDDLPLAEKNRNLQAMLLERSRNGRTRLYYEPTFIYNGLAVTDYDER